MKFNNPCHYIPMFVIVDCVQNLVMLLVIVLFTVKWLARPYQSFNKQLQKDFHKSEHYFGNTDVH